MWKGNGSGKGTQRMISCLDHLYPLALVQPATLEHPRNSHILVSQVWSEDLLWLANFWLLALRKHSLVSSERLSLSFSHQHSWYIASKIVLDVSMLSTLKLKFNTRPQHCHSRTFYIVWCRRWNKSCVSSANMEILSLRLCGSHTRMAFALVDRKC